MKLIHEEALAAAATRWRDNLPFPHLIIDDFFEMDIAEALEKEFPDYHSANWHVYSNKLENKKTCNDWNIFPEYTYKVFTFLNSPDFTEILSKYLCLDDTLHSDPGLHGGGWHIHGDGGKLNTHLDYDLHPKLEMRRKLNVIVYLNSRWQTKWGGRLGFWGNESAREPGALVKEIDPRFNRAVIFDTSKNSWHGIIGDIRSSLGEYRRSIAVYYLVASGDAVERRKKALFAPTEEQKNDPLILDLINKRSDAGLAASVYRFERDE